MKMKSKTLIKRLRRPGTLMTNGQQSYNTLTTTTAALLSSSSKAQNCQLNLTEHRNRTTNRLSLDKLSRLVLSRILDHFLCLGWSRSRTSSTSRRRSNLWLILFSFVFFFLFQSSSVVVSAFIIPSSNLDQSQNQNPDQHQHHQLPVDPSDDEVTISQSIFCRPSSKKLDRFETMFSVL